jgi:hypothetical protein
MRTWISLLLILLSSLCYAESTAVIVGQPRLVVDDTYTGSVDGGGQIDAAEAVAGCQAFTSTGGTLYSMKFTLRKGGSGQAPTGNMAAVLYAETHATAFGTDSVGTGSVLATSETLNTATGLTTDYAEYEFLFTGANKYTLVSGTTYMACISYTGGDANNQVDMAYDTTSPGHAGNYAEFTPWAAYVAGDALFSVYVWR